MQRKIWVKRPNASATLVTINEADLVDDSRDMILRKYANSLGRSYDAPDVTLRIVPREDSTKLQDRHLGPEEPLARTIDEYYPGGQTVHEALLIDVPQKRTLRLSPGFIQGMPRYTEDQRPLENGTGYFPPMPSTGPSSPGPHALGQHETRQGHHHHHSTNNPHAISVLETGQVPALPSPRERRSHRPKYARQHTSSPTIATQAAGTLTNLHHPPRQGRSRHEASISEQMHTSHAPAPPPLPTPPATDAGPAIPGRISNPTTPRMSSPRPSKSRKSRKSANETGLLNGQASYGVNPAIVDGSVPPINVLIVEDNPINLRLLEAFVKRLKVRWQTAMNGREAVNKWRKGGFHLVLMDIQLPIMNGLEATKEIRRLERVNGIGVFARSESESDTRTDSDTTAVNGTESAQDDDKLQFEGLLKSPVIIVALTASSLQSDRHEALAAGCNDFLTKPVLFPWFERKVMEWGCMQALIDFNGWRAWKDFAADTSTSASKSDKAADRKGTGMGTSASSGGGSSGALTKSAEEKTKRMSLGTGGLKALQAIDA